VSCRHHLYLDVSPVTGSIKFNFDAETRPGDDRCGPGCTCVSCTLERMPETCALDVADRGGITLEETGAMLELTRERARQVEQTALLQLRVFETLAGMELPSDREAMFEHPVEDESGRETRSVPLPADVLAWERRTGLRR
jgi:hypothetical protein